MPDKTTKVARIAGRMTPDEVLGVARTLRALGYGVEISVDAEPEEREAQLRAFVGETFFPHACRAGRGKRRRGSLPARGRSA